MLEFEERDKRESRSEFFLGGFFLSTACQNLTLVFSHDSRLDKLMHVAIAFVFEMGDSQPESPLLW